MDHFGIVRAYDVVTERKGSFCFMYNPLFKELPGAGDHAVSSTFCSSCTT